MHVRLQGQKINPSSHNSGRKAFLPRSHPRFANSGALKSAITLATFNGVTRPHLLLKILSLRTSAHTGVAIPIVKAVFSIFQAAAPGRRPAYRTPGGFHHPALALEALPIPDSPFIAFRISIASYHQWIKNARKILCSQMKRCHPMYRWHPLGAYRIMLRREDRSDHRTPVFRSNMLPHLHPPTR